MMITGIGRPRGTVPVSGLATTWRFVRGNIAE